MNDDRDSRIRGLSRRSALQMLAAGATFGITGLAGCSGNGGDGGDGGTTDGGSQEPVSIGLQVEQTGALSSWGFWHERIITNYVEELNNNGGIDGREVELYTEDTGSESQQGIQAFRALVERENVDFVIGSQSSGISIATNPLAKQLEVPYFPLGEAPSITGSDGNRWVIRNTHDSAQVVSHVVNHALGRGENWTVIYQDYSFGQQFRDLTVSFTENESPSIVEEIGVPVGETDLTSYLNQVPDETDVLINALVAGSAINFLSQTSELDVPGDRIGDVTSIEGVDIGGLGEGADGAEFISAYPRRFESNPTDANERIRELAGVDDTDNVLVGSHYINSFEALSWIRDGVEETGWSSPDDHQEFVQWFEGGPSKEESIVYPQGEGFFRGADHQCFMNQFVERITDGQLELVDEISVNEPMYKPSANLADQSF